MKEKVAVSWSGGKDCALALHEIIRDNQFEIHSLHTVFDQSTKRVGLHGIQQRLIEEQSRSIGIRLDKIYLPATQDHAAYEKVINEYYQRLTKEGIGKVVFGDIFLADLKSFREKILSMHGLEGIFPLWKLDSRELAEKFIRKGFKAVVCAADAKYFNESEVGCEYNFEFVRSLPDDVDPCGENGEFHTFVYNGPLFKKPVSFERHQIEAKGYEYKVTLPDGQSESRVSKFWFQELS